MASNKGLGKGLGALLGDFDEPSAQQSPYKLLPIYKVEPRRCRNPLRSTASYSR